ncbi:MAG: hypothetical protein PHQ65_17660 [Bacteroidales bacterium]|nr:hypothetical protein [Bacteroidales bacterium]
MKKSILVLLAVVAIIGSSCEKEWGYYYYLQNDLPDSLIIKQVIDNGYSNPSVATKEYVRFSRAIGSGWQTTYYDTPEKFEAILFTYKGKTYREDRKGGYSALNSAVYGKPTQPEFQSFIDYCFVFNITEEYLATLPEVTE